MDGLHCPADLLRHPDPPAPVLLGLTLDSQGCPQGERINGYVQCPVCKLWWPHVESPCAWRRERRAAGKVGQRVVVTEWWGAAVCEVCRLLLIEQPDGHGEVYQL